MFNSLRHSPGGVGVVLMLGYCHRGARLPPPPPELMRHVGSQLTALKLHRGSHRVGTRLVSAELAENASQVRQQQRDKHSATLRGHILKLVAKEKK